MSASILMLAATLLQMACERTIEEGEFRYLTIGKDKKEVVSQLIASGETNYVMPVVPSEGMASLEYVSGDPEFAESGGLLVRGPEFLMRIRIENDIVTETYIAPSPVHKLTGIEQGDSRKTTMDKLSAFIKDNPKYGVSHLTATRNWIGIYNLTEDDWDRLASSDIWSFHENSRYSSVMLLFEDEILTQIVYKWSPVELP